MASPKEVTVAPACSAGDKNAGRLATQWSGPSSLNGIQVSMLLKPSAGHNCIQVKQDALVIGRTINLGRVARSVRNAQVIIRSVKSYEESEDVYRIHSRDGGRGQHP